MHVVPCIASAPLQHEHTGRACKHNCALQTGQIITVILSCPTRLRILNGDKIYHSYGTVVQESRQSTVYTGECLTAKPQKATRRSQSLANTGKNLE